MYQENLKPNKTNPDRPCNLSGLILCILRRNYIFLDRRGRRSLQGEIKLPYENQPLSLFFLSDKPSHLGYVHICRCWLINYKILLGIFAVFEAHLTFGVIKADEFLAVKAGVARKEDL